MSDAEEYQRRMQHERFKQGPAKSSPAAPDGRRGADWGRGLDAASANKQAVTDWLADVYRARNDGKEPPSSLVSMFTATAEAATGEPPKEPDYGPGLWYKMAQERIDAMAEARPIDLNGDPSALDLNLMMAHAIRMGERLCRTYPDWSLTLPKCWIRHDYIVEEVFALACYADLAVAQPNGGYYLPSWQANVAAALQRIKDQMKLDGSDKDRHPHHMEDEDSRLRRELRVTEYGRWVRGSGQWPKHKGEMWKGGDDFDIVLTRYGWPPSPAPAPAPSDEGIARSVGDWTRTLQEHAQKLDEIRGKTGGRPDDDPDWQREIIDAQTEADAMELAWHEWRSAERDAHDELDKAVARARRRLDDPSDPLPRSAAVRLTDLIAHAEELLGQAGDPNHPREYTPQSVDRQESLRDQLAELTSMHEDKPLERMRAIIGQASAILAGRNG